MVETERPKGAWADVKPERAARLLPLLEGRRSQMDEQLWGGPALLLTAQAFLYAAAFNSGTPHWARIAVLAVGVVPLLVAWQAMAKKRHLEVTYSEAVSECMRVLQLPEIRRTEPGTLLIEQAHTWAYEMFVVKPKNHRGWMYAFGVFIATDLTFMTLTISNVK